jgi:hypothetical protein
MESRSPAMDCSVSATTEDGDWDKPRKPVALSLHRRRDPVRSCQIADETQFGAARSRCILLNGDPPIEVDSAKRTVEGHFAERAPLRRPRMQRCAPLRGGFAACDSPKPPPFSTVHARVVPILQARHFRRRMEGWGSHVPPTLQGTGRLRDVWRIRGIWDPQPSRRQAIRLPWRVRSRASGRMEPSGPGTPHPNAAPTANA